MKLPPSVLALPRKGEDFSLDTDACSHQVGFALFQDQPDGRRHPIVYWSRTLTKAESNYSMTEKECLALVYGVLTCRPYLLGQWFVINTYHSALRWLMEINDPSGRLRLWRLRLAEYDFTDKHRRGHTHWQTDAASRLPTNAPTTE